MRSTCPLFVHALLGTSRQVAAGPIALASLLVATGINELAAGAQLAEAQFITFALLLTAVAGISQIILGPFRLFGLVNVHSHPIVSGATTAATLMIGASQLKYMFGLQIPSESSAIETVHHMATDIGEAHGLTFLVGLLAFIMVVGLSRWRPD
ncbi:MAG: SulP family inorganic anion transporter [Myxococcota bacterium]|nr:SulP family inorganic anion transporter [Myxococcota bacterium]